MCSTLFLRAHEHISFMECALSQNVLLPLLMVYILLLECITITTITITSSFYGNTALENALVMAYTVNPLYLASIIFSVFMPEVY